MKPDGLYAQLEKGNVAYLLALPRPEGARRCSSSPMYRADRDDGQWTGRLLNERALLRARPIGCRPRRQASGLIL